METSPRARFADLLGASATGGSFSARRTARADGLRLEVAGVGPIALPVSAPQAKQLCLIGRPARFGKGEQTLLDAAVRDTWEIPKSRLKIDQPTWKATLRPILDHLRADLGLPPECRLAAQFHSMLVYAPGQFFAPHQDSEKADAMIGTLVMTLPSASVGGALVIEHAGQSVTYRPSKSSLSFVAFYADCRHHVLPVSSGYRVALTYNLLLEGDTVAAYAPSVDPRLTAELAGCLNDHFAGSDKPGRLVYLLDHEYTQRALGWARLKGADAERAGLVRAAAQAADCAVALALTEVHETWSAEEADPWGSRGWDDRYWEDEEGDEDDDAENPDDYEAQELIDSTTTLECWLDESNALAAVSLTISEDEVCATTPTASLSPHDSAYEGYMGNYGNTLDRWYRRAAIVVWPRRWDFAIRAESSPGWTLDRLADMIAAGDAVKAQEAVASLPPAWNAAVTANAAKMLVKALPVALGLGAPSAAARLLEPFRIEKVNGTHAAGLARLAERYGGSWAHGSIRGWFRQPYAWKQTEQLDWLESFPSLCEALRKASEGGVTVGRLMAATAGERLREQIGEILRQPKPSSRDKALQRLGPAVAGLLKGMAIVAAPDARAEMIGFFCQNNDDLLVCAMSTLRAADKAYADGDLEPLARHCAERLQARLARPARTAGNWAIDPPSGCRCEPCQTMAAFLSNPSQRTLAWPLAEQKRKHLHVIIENTELPVRHQTQRSGRPYTLVLNKTDDLFAREREARSRDKTDLAWLGSTFFEA
jgi:hypothetical protein